MTGSRSEIRRDCVQRPFDAAARVIELEAEAEELKKRPDYIEMAKKIRYFKDRVEELEGVNSYGRACIVNDRLRTNLAEAVQLFEVIGFSPEHDPQQCDCVLLMIDLGLILPKPYSCLRLLASVLSMIHNNVTVVIQRGRHRAVQPAL